jgi:hypothetical protein
MGENGNNIILYDTDSFLIQNQLKVNHIVKDFEFAKMNKELIVVTKSCEIIFYDLTKFEGEVTRKL